MTPKKGDGTPKPKPGGGDIRKFFSGGAKKPEAAAAAAPAVKKEKTSRHFAADAADAPIIIPDDDDVMVVEETKPPAPRRAAPPAKPPPAPAPAPAPPPPKRPAPARSPAAAPKRPKSAAAAAVTPAPAFTAPGAAEAQAAVRAALAAAPPLASLRYSVQLETAPAAGRVPDAPPNAGGSKAYPRGHPDALAGLSFAVSGVLDSLTRPAADAYIKRHGGRVVSAVSGKTDVLVVGMECGKSKMKKAEANVVDAAAGKKVKATVVVDEDGLLALVAATQPPPEPMEEEEEAGASAPPAAATAPRGATAAGSAPPPPSSAAPPPSGSGPPQLWVDKFKPTTAKDLVGNAAAINTLRVWLRSWDDVHLRGRPPPKPPSTAKAVVAAMGRAAVLLSGPPGVGKTSAALALARELGYDPVEVNASDARNKSDADVAKGVGGRLSNAVRELATNTALPGASGAARRPLLIMDEVDGMSGGDRGGVVELAGVVRGTRVPVICIANDKWCQKLKPLRAHVLELDFRKPDKAALAKRLAAVCAAEGLQAGEAALQALAEGANCDVRAVLGQLQLIRLKKRTLSYDDAAGRFGTSKDATMSPFDAARSLMDAGGAGATITARLDAAFTDLDLVPLLIAENYVNFAPVVAGGHKDARLRLLARAADGVSAGDVLTRRVRGGQVWSLAPAAAVMGCVYPAAYVRGTFQPFGLYPGEPAFTRFTAWLGHNSSSGKQRRLLADLGARLAAHGGAMTGRGSLRCDTVPALRAVVTAPFRAAGAGPDAAAEAATVLRGVGLGKDDFDFLADVTKFKSPASSSGPDPYASVAAPVKAAFTRALNKDAPPARWNKDDGGFVRKGKKGKGAAAAKGKGKKAVTPASDEEDDDSDADADDSDADLPPDVAAERRAAKLARGGIVFEAKGATPPKKGKGAAGKGKAKK